MSLNWTTTPQKQQDIFVWKFLFDFFLYVNIFFIIGFYFYDEGKIIFEETSNYIGNLLWRKIKLLNQCVSVK